MAKKGEKLKQFCPKLHDTFTVGRTSEGTCKTCDSLMRAKWKAANPTKVKAYDKVFHDSYYEANAEDIKAKARTRNKENPEYMKQYNTDNKEKLQADAKVYYIEVVVPRLQEPERKEEMAAYQKDYHEKNKEELSVASKIHYEENREAILAYQKVYAKENRTKITAHNRERKKIDPLFKLSKNLSNRIHGALKAKSWTKNNSTKDILGCSLDELKAHLEKQFLPGMTWQNNTLEGWHLDHIYPLAKATSVEELIRLCHYTNLQPLWAD